MEANNGSQLPFKGKFQAEESRLDTPHHDLVGSGNGTHLGRFTYIAHVDINEATGTVSARRLGRRLTVTRSPRLRPERLWRKPSQFSPSGRSKSS